MTTITVSIGEAGETNVDTSKFNAAVNAYIFQYGLKQMLNDVHAGETKAKTADDATRKANKLALVEKKLASLYAGEVAQARVGSTGSPVEREMRAMAEADLKAKIKSIGKKVSDYEKDVWTKVVGKQVEANEAAYRAAATAKLAIKPETNAGDADDLLAMLAGTPETPAPEETPTEETPTEETPTEETPTE